MKKQKLDDLDWQREAALTGAAHLAGRLEKSYHAKHRMSEAEQFDNRPVFGNYLLALKEFA